MRKFLILAPVLALTACAQAADTVNSDATPERVQLETAKYFSTSSRNVRVGSINKTMLGTQYKAQVGGRMFDCHYVRGSVTCQYA